MAYMSTSIYASASETMDLVTGSKMELALEHAVFRRPVDSLLWSIPPSALSVAMGASRSSLSIEKAEDGVL
jgi:hypothetical protein